MNIQNTSREASARIRELVLDKRVVDSGARGLTNSGRNAIRWIAA